MGLQGNDIADSLANIATKFSNIHRTETTMGHFHQKLIAYKQATTTILLNSLQNKPWIQFYQNTLMPSHNIIQNRHIDTQSRLLRTSAYQHSFKSTSTLLCATCQVQYTPTHFLLKCSKHYAETLHLFHIIPPYLKNSSLQKQAEHLLRLNTIQPNTHSLKNIPMLTKTHPHSNFNILL